MRNSSKCHFLLKICKRRQEKALTMKLFYIILLASGLCSLAGIASAQEESQKLEKVIASTLRGSDLDYDAQCDRIENAGIGCKCMNPVATSFGRYYIRVENQCGKNRRVSVNYVKFGDGNKLAAVTSDRKMVDGENKEVDDFELNAIDCFLVRHCSYFGFLYWGCTDWKQYTYPGDDAVVSSGTSMDVHLCA